MQPAIFSSTPRRLQHKQAQALSRRVIYLLLAARERERGCVFAPPFYTFSSFLARAAAPGRGSRNLHGALCSFDDSSAPDGNLDTHERGRQLWVLPKSQNLDLFLGRLICDTFSFATKYFEGYFLQQNNGMVLLG